MYSKTDSHLQWAIPLLFFALMLGVPLALIVSEAFFSGGAFTLEPVGRVLGDPYFQRLAWFTTKQAALSALASTVLGLFWAFVLVRYRFPFKRTLQSLTIVPFVLPAVSLALGFVIVFGNKGMLNTALVGLFGFQRPPVHVLYSLNAIVLAHAFYNAPIVARLAHAAWERIDPSYEEGARALGANRVRTFAGVTLPLLLPGILTGTALAFIYSFLSFPIVLTLGSAQFSTLEVEIYVQTITLRNQTLGASLALVQVLLSLAFTYGYLWLERRFSYRLDAQRPRPTLPLLSARHPLRQLLVVGLALAGLFFAAPLLGVLVDSFQTTNGAWTVAWYGYIFNPDFDAFIGSSPLQSVLNSVRLALGTMLLALALGVPLARAVVRGRAWLNTLAMAPLAISSVALGFGLLRAFSLPGLAGVERGLAVMAAHTLLALPFVVRALVPVLQGLDPSLHEAARSLGGTRWRVFFQIELPLLRTALLAGAAFAFAISIGEMSATLMLTQGGFKTMPVSVYNFLGARLFGAASAMSVILILVTGVSFILIERSGERVMQ